MKETDLTLTPNGRGATAYLPRDVLEDSACPLQQGFECRAVVYRGVGILLVPRTDPNDYTIKP